MQRVAKRTLRFVRELISGREAERNAADRFVVVGATPPVMLEAAVVLALGSTGVLEIRNDRCSARPEARSWLKRQMLDADAYAAQHGTVVPGADGQRLNLTESPLARLATGAEPFLEPHQVEVGERVRRLVERAQLQPRVTMSYSAAHTAGGKGRGHAADIGSMAMEARAALRELHDLLPRDCASVVLDVCGFMKGLQQIESEKGWPRRSAKLVLRIGLEQLAQHYGLAPHVVGPATRRARVWLDNGARPTVVG